MQIGVLDSGIGGLNVLASLIKHRCGEKYLYLADTRNLPYGDKSREELREIALAGVRKLIEAGANLLVLGCNTLSISALDYLRKRVELPLFGLSPRPELLSGKSLMMVTPATALSLPRIEPNVSLLTPARLASLIESDYPNQRRIKEYLTPLLLPYADCESLYLGCSHYLYAKETIRSLLPRAKMQDGCDRLAALVRAVLPPSQPKSAEVDFLFTGENRTERYAGILQSLLR